MRVGFSSSAPKARNPFELQYAGATDRRSVSMQDHAERDSPEGDSPRFLLRQNTTNRIVVVATFGEQSRYAEFRNMRSPAGGDSIPVNRLSTLVKEPGDRRSA